MNTTLNKIVSVLAFLIGGMAIFAGGKVLLGSDPGYYVIHWVPVYNYSTCILTVFITAILIWANSRFARLAAVGTFSLHTLVMLALQTPYRDAVAPDSISSPTMLVRELAEALQMESGKTYPADQCCLGEAGHLGQFRYQ